MIAIDVTMTPKTDRESLTIEDSFPIAEQWYFDIHKFFKSCIDQNMILNITDDNPAQNVTRYFATTIENAQMFQQAFSDMSAEFSMKKMWDQSGFDITFKQQEIEFDTIDSVVDLIGPYGEIWGVEF